MNYSLKSRIVPIALVTGAAAALLLVSSSAGQPVNGDHLKCYKIKDSQTKALYTADVEGLVAEPGCTIKVPAAMACVPATKTNVEPPPPGGGGTGTPGWFVCYKVKCPALALPTLQLNDQFGSRAVTPIKPKLLCAPAVPVTTSTTTSTSTTTTVAFPPCPTPSAVCGSCGTGLCMPLCDRGCINACVDVHVTVPCSSDASCPAGQGCVATIIPFCDDFGCGSGSQPNCATPCP